MLRRNFAVLLGISLVWGSQWIVAPLLAVVAAPLAMSALVFGVAFALLLAAGGAVRLWRSFKDPSDLFPREAIAPAAILACSLFLLPDTLRQTAATHGAGAWSLLTGSMLPLVVAFSSGRWSTAMIVAVGATLLLLNGTAPFTLRAAPWAGLTLLSVASQAFAIRYAARRLAEPPDRHPTTRPALLRLLTIQCGFAALVLCGESLLFDPAPRVAAFAHWGTPSITALVLLGCVGTAATYAGLYWLLAGKQLRPEQVATGQWLQLLVFVSEGACFDRAMPSVSLLCAWLVLGVCAWVVLREPYDPRGVFSVSIAPVTSADTRGSK